MNQHHMNTAAAVVAAGIPGTHKVPFHQWMNVPKPSSIFSYVET